MTAITVRRCRRLQRLFTVFRWAEAVTVLLLSLRFAPAAARASGDFLRLSLSVLLGPRFLFLLGNAIVLLLFFFSKTPAASPAAADDYAGGTAAAVLSSFVPPPPAVLPPAAREEVVFEDKEVVVSSAGRACRRSRSERMDGRRRKASPAPELRRSRTGVDPTGGAKAEEDAEEFRRTVEAFIEKQLKFQRQESVSVSASVSAYAEDDGNATLAIVSVGGATKKE